jgi:broad specificity phosphatase PhoE
MDGYISVIFSGGEDLFDQFFFSLRGSILRFCRYASVVRTLTAWAILFFPCVIALNHLAVAQTDIGLQGQALVNALRQGGYNLYFRHAATDWSQNDQVLGEGDWTSCDPGRMRQLSETGRRTAIDIGKAMRSLQIPVGKVLASPYCRTVETASEMGLGSVETTTDIMNMRVAEYFGGTTAIAESTRRRLSMIPPAATNTVLVAHGNVLVTATEVYPQEAEAVVFRPGGDGMWEYVTRIPPKEWVRLASEYSEP